MPRSEVLHTCSRCGATARSDVSPPAGWSISVSWSSPADEPKRRDDFKRHEVCGKHREELDQVAAKDHLIYLEREAAKHGQMLIPVRALSSEALLDEVLNAERIARRKEEPHA